MRQPVGADADLKVEWGSGSAGAYHKRQVTGHAVAEAISKGQREPVHSGWHPAISPKVIH
jgi:hypothetical protein